jgi:hypothetical protein
MRRKKLSKSKVKLPLFNTPLSGGVDLSIVEGNYYYSRGGWVARVVYVDNRNEGRCYAIHNPGTPYESSPIIHELKTGYAVPLFSVGEPPAYTGHPADLVKEVTVQ